MNKNISLLIISCLLLTGNFKAQDERSTRFQDYTPSVLITKGQTEFKLFNSLYTQTHFFDGEGAKK